jgi:hypothetical protein
MSVPATLMLLAEHPCVDEFRFGVYAEAKAIGDPLILIAVFRHLSDAHVFAGPNRLVWEICSTGVAPVEEPTDS